MAFDALSSVRRALGAGRARQDRLSGPSRSSGNGVLKGSGAAGGATTTSKAGGSRPIALLCDVLCITLSAFLLISCYFGNPLPESWRHRRGNSSTIATPVVQDGGGFLKHASERRLLQQEGARKPRIPEWAKSIPAMTIFCAPKPYSPDKNDPQRRALLSWLRLRPQPHVVLLGSDNSFFELSKEFPSLVSVETNIDYNFNGVPLFHSMVDRAKAASTPLSMLINGDIILLPDIMPVIGRIHNYFENYLITAARWDVEEFPFSADLLDWNQGLPLSSEKQKEIWQYVWQNGSLHSYGGVDLWLWNNSPVPLHSEPMPPFAFGRGKYDNWMTHEAISSGLRQVVDASTALTSIHVSHSYSHVQASVVSKQGSFWSTRKKSSWELFANIHMAEKHGSYTNQKGTALHAPWKLMSCDEPDSLNICLMKRERPANCTCEYSAYVKKSQSDPKVHKSGDFWVCGSVSQDATSEFEINPVARPNSTAGLPHTMEQILPQVAKDVGGLKVVTLVAVTVGYTEMLMNFVCNLRQLGLADNLVVAALDEALYKYAFLQGLAVYYEQPSINMKAVDNTECQFGSQCFRQFTKLKSRAVLRVLKTGYSVLWSDVDIVWFKDPLPHLMSFGAGTFPIQSNEPNASIPGTGIRRINSGFYFARADTMTVKAFEAIVAHAAMTRLSEQPSFYDVLCGEQGQLLVNEQGIEACKWTSGLKTIFLDRRMYPNGAVYGFWNATNVAHACSGCTILHNNWISGKNAKKDRLADNGFWYYDTAKRMCVWPWTANVQETLQTSR